MLHPPSKERQGNLLETLLASLKGLRADSHVLEDEGATVDVLKKILAREECRSAVIAGLPSAVRRVVEKALEGYECHSVEELRGPEAVSTLANADVGVTWAEYGIANQGAIMEVAYDDAVKLASSLPFHHIVLLSSRKVLPDISQAMAEVGKIITSSPPDRKPVISFISGPSKTGDIEMKLLYGVHGPNTLSVLLLDWC